MVVVAYTQALRPMSHVARLCMTLLLREHLCDSTCVSKELEKGVVSQYSILSSSSFCCSQGCMVLASHGCRSRACAHGSAPLCGGKGAFTGAPLIDDDAG